MSGKLPQQLALVATGLLGAWWATRHGGREHRGAQLRQRRRVGRQARRQSRGAAVETHAEPGGEQAAAPAVAAPAAARAGAGGPSASSSSSSSSSGWAGYLGLLLLALLSAAAVVYAEQLRPLGVSSSEWQQLVAAGGLGGTALGAAGWLLLARRRRWAALATPVAGLAAAATDGAPAGMHVVAAAAVAAPLQDLSGTWLKSKDESDAMDEACDAMHLGGLVRTAIKLIKGLQLSQDEAAGQFTMSLFSVIAWFKITERYQLDGTPARFRRRDLRRGKHTGHVERCPSSGGLLLKVVWDAPHGGSGCDHFYLPSPDVLHVDTILVVDGRKVQYRQVYRRKR